MLFVRQVFATVRKTETRTMWVYVYTLDFVERMVEGEVSTPEVGFGPQNHLYAVDLVSTFEGVVVQPTSLLMDA